MNWKNFACTMTAMVGLILIAVCGYFGLYGDSKSFNPLVFFLITGISLALSGCIMCSVICHCREVKGKKNLDELTKSKDAIISEKDSTIADLRVKIKEFQNQARKEERLSQEIAELNRKMCCMTATSHKIAAFYEYVVMPWVRQQVNEQNRDVKKDFSEWEKEYIKFEERFGDLYRKEK